MLQEVDTKKIEILCEKHGKQVVNLIDDNGKHYISECIYCSEERVMKHFGAEIARMHVEDALDEIPFNLRDKSLDNFIIEVQEDKEAAIRTCLAICHGELSSTVFIGNPPHWKNTPTRCDSHRGTAPREVGTVHDREGLAQGDRDVSGVLRQ